MNIFSNKLKFKRIIEKNTDYNYYYNIKDSLDTIFTNDFNDIYLCFYFIDKDRPILKYFLENKKFNFFKLNVKTDVKTDCIDYVKTLFDCEFKLMGYKIDKKKMFIFVNISLDEKNSIGEWCVMDEICNKKCFLQYSICENVSNFFLNNPEFIYLRNKDNLKIEVPIVAFQNCNNLLDLMYYKYNNNISKKFYNYQNCKKKYIMRYILFLSYDSLIFNKSHQYCINYSCKPESVNE